MSRTLLPPSKQTAIHRPSKSVSQLPSILPPTSRLAPRGSALRPPSTFIPAERTNSASPTSSASSFALTVVHNVQPPSPPPPQSLYPSITNLLLTNLRLLDLDQQIGWPHATVKTFSATANQKERIKVVEWILYQLFALWDPAETTYKLQPFFPPLEPLQSLNLRAALFRCLDSLKKDGVLGRDVVLRKTMLDECKGEKLIEVLLNFSTVILKKVQIQRAQADDRSTSISMKMISNTGGSPAMRASMIPLAIVYKADLAQQMKKKDEKRTHFAAFADMIRSKNTELLDRQKTCDNVRHPEITEAQEEKALRSMQANWTGTSSWPHAVLHGDAENVLDEPFQRPFGEIWGVMVDGKELQPNQGDSPGLITQLEERIGVQRRRLSEWKTWKEKMSKLIRHGEHSAIVRVENGLAKPNQLFNFTQHRELHLSRSTTGHSTSVRFTPKSVGRYQGIIAEMETKLEDSRKSYRVTDTSTDFLDIAVERRAPASRVQQQAQAIDSVTSTQPRAPSNPLQPPRQFTLKRSFSPASIFSPLRNVPVSKDDDDSADISLSDVLGLDKSGSQDSLGTPSANAGTMRPQAAEKMTERVVEPDTAAEPTDALTEALANLSIRPSGAAQPKHDEPELAPSSTSLSLAERTRLSMAAFSRPTTKRTKSTLSADEKAEPTKGAYKDVEEVSNPEDRLDSLAERTRQSLAFMMQPPSEASSEPTAEFSRSRISMGGNEIIGTRFRRPRDSILQPKKTRQSLSYPVNQFETPRKPSPLSGFSEEDEENLGGDDDIRASNEAFAREIRRIATPTEKLFAADADPASVFRSRPKIMASPILSPHVMMDDMAGSYSPLEGR